MTATLKTYMGLIDLTCRRLDRVQRHPAQGTPTTGLIVLHGLAMYARDSARSAASLLRADQTLPAAVLGRVILEHAALAQWLKVDPEGRGQLCLDQGATSRARWLKAVLEVGDTEKPGREAWQEEQGRMPPGTKSAAPEFNSAALLFGETAAGKELYLTYRNLSSFVHPDAATFTRYPLPGTKRWRVRPRLRKSTHGQSEAAYYAAWALVLCAVPYLELLQEVDAARAVRAAADAAGTGTSID